MADAVIRFAYASGEELDVQVSVDESYPDAVAEAKAQALALFREAYATLSDKAGDSTE